jgi:NitT/TauT family transport system substrate-binding protein
MQHSRARFLTVAASATALALPSAGRAQAAPIRVASTAGDSYAEALIAQDEGFFKAAGLPVEVTVLTNGAAVAAAVASGAIDVGITSPMTLAQGRERGVPFKVLCPGGMYNPDEIALCVLANSPIRVARDLNGQTIGVSALKDMNWLSVMAWLDQNGGDSSTIHLIEVPFSAMGAALKRGALAAIPVSEPALSVLRAQGGIRVLMPHLFDVFGRNFMIGAWFAESPWIEKNRDFARRFVETIYATGKWANAHPDETTAIIAKHAQIDPAIARAMSRAPYGDSLAPSMLQGPFDLAYKYKILDRPLNASDVIARL